MSDFDFALLAELEESTAGGTLNYSNFGETWIDNVTLSSWNDTTKKYERVEYKGQKFDATKAHIEFQIHQLLTKKDGTEYTKTWYVDKRHSGKRPQDKKDWHEIIRPSAETVFKSEAAFFKAMGKHAYCFIEDFDTGRVRTGTKNGEAVEYPVTAPKFLAVYKSKAEMEAAKAERFKSKETADMSFGDDVPADVINNVKAFLQSVGPEQAKDILSVQAPYDQYDWNKLVELAQG
jgi:hypothetical protein